MQKLLLKIINMIQFIKNNFKIGDTISVYCDNIGVINGKLIEIRDKEILLLDLEGHSLLLRSNISGPISFHIAYPDITKHEAKESNVQNLESSFSSTNKPLSSFSSSTISIFLSGYGRFRAGKLPSDGTLSCIKEMNKNNKEEKKYIVRDNQNNVNHYISPANVIDEIILNSIREKRNFNNEEVNFILEQRGGVSNLHNMSVESLLSRYGSQDVKKKIIENYVKRKLERMMPGGDPIEIRMGKKLNNYKLTDEERCHYLLSLLNRILDMNGEYIDFSFKTDILNLKVQVIEKLLLLKPTRFNYEELEKAINKYLEYCVPLKVLLRIPDNIISNKYIQLAETQIQLSRSREVILNNANKAYVFAPNSQEALKMKEKAEKLPLDIWHDNRDIEISDGESAILGIPLDQYLLDKKKANVSLNDIKMADHNTSHRVIDCIKDDLWRVLADDSLGDIEKKEAISCYLNLSLAPGSTDSGIELLFKALYSNDVLRKEKAWNALISIGTASKNTWNLLLKSEGMEKLYTFFEKENRLQTYQIINKVTDLILDTDQPPYRFLRSIFNLRRDQIKQLLQMEPKLYLEEIRYFDDIIECLNEMKRFQIFNDTEKNDILVKMYDVANSLRSYETYDDDERIIRLNDAADQLTPIINLVKNYPMLWGSILFKLPLENWQKKIRVTHTQKKSLRQPKFSVFANPPYIQEKDKGLYKEAFFNICIENIGQQSADGYKLDITLTPEDSSYEEIRLTDTAKTIKIGAGNKDSMRVKIPTSIQGAKVINASIYTEAFFGERWLSPTNSRFTLYHAQDVSDSFIKSKEEILFNTSQTAKDEIFKGREHDIEKLKNHYLGKKRSEIFILYGLSRTGKSSIAENLMREIEGKCIYSNDGRKLTIIPFSWPFEQISDVKDNDELWSTLLERCILLPLEEDYKNQLNININIGELLKEHYNVNDFSITLDALNKANIYPFIVIDEFQYLKKLLISQDGSSKLSDAFVHSIRQKATKGLASFLFAGTYEIKDLMHNPTYGLNNGQFGTTNEIMINRIEEKYAEELMTVMGNKLQFTREAIQYIHKLSDDIPFFVQIICEACADYALANHRNYIGYPELNHVICCLTGEDSGTEEGINRIVEGRFNGNMLDSSHPMEEDILRYITLYNRERPINPRPVGYNYLKECWSKEYPNRTENDFRGTLNMLIEKEIIKDTNDIEYNEVTYSIKVDLFRRWFTYKEEKINN